MQLDGVTVSALVAVFVALAAVCGAALYALWLLRRTEEAGKTALRDIVRMVFHGR